MLDAFHVIQSHSSHIGNNNKEWYVSFQQNPHIMQLANNYCSEVVLRGCIAQELYIYGQLVILRVVYVFVLLFSISIHFKNVLSCCFFYIRYMDYIIID